jgi:integrase
MLILMLEGLKMARGNQLSAKEVASAAGKRTRSLLCDGAGLWLQVTTGGASWLYKYTAANGRPRSVGLGPYPDCTLAKARDRRLKAARQRLDDIDPKDARHADRAKALAVITFGKACALYLAAHESGMSTPSMRQWRSSLRDHAAKLAPIPVQNIDTAAVLRTLTPIWDTLNETASRLRGRIERILDWAKVHGHRGAGDNPAAWKGNLKEGLPKPSAVQSPRQHAAMAYQAVPAFMEELRGKDGGAARALEFTIMCASRSAEVLGMTWGELGGDTWIIPPGRMKNGEEHRVPLSARALAILDSVRPNIVDPAALVFGKLGQATMRAVLHKMGHTDLTVHGFRSTFADWCNETTDTPNAVRELALAHAVGNAVVSAYSRSDLLTKRRKLMEAWGDHCGAAPGSVVAFLPATGGTRPAA